MLARLRRLSAALLLLPCACIANSPPPPVTIDIHVHGYEGAWLTTTGDREVHIHIDDGSEAGAHESALARASSSPASIACERSEWVHAGDSQYCATEAHMSWDEGREACDAHGASMAVFDTPEEATRLRRAALGPADYGWLWLDLHRDADDGFTWNGGPSQVDHERFRWRRNEPNDAHGGESCIHMSVLDGGYNDTKCAGQRNAVVCERPSSAAACPGERFSTAAGEYCALGLITDLHGAVAACSEAGLALVRLETAEEHQLFAAAIRSPVRSLTFWVGANDHRIEGEWTWNDGNAFPDQAWRPNEPNNAGDEDCGQWRLDHERMNDLRCHKSQPVICERSANEPEERRG